MDAPASASAAGGRTGPPSAAPAAGERPLRELNELLYAGLGLLALTADATDELADDLARRLGVGRDELRRALADTLASWRREAERLGRRPGEAGERALRRLGLVRREELDDLLLRIAQLEHRVQLLERG
jgi:polyhydroxyalkanoate synthesis regulator phasin